MPNFYTEAMLYRHLLSDLKILGTVYVKSRNTVDALIKLDRNVQYVYTKHDRTYTLTYTDRGEMNEKLYRA